MTTWEDEKMEEDSQKEFNQEMLAASQEEDAKLEDLPDDEDPYWEE